MAEPYAGPKTTAIETLTRRAWLTGGASVAVLAALWWMRDGGSADAGTFEIVKSDDEWRSLLKPAAYRVLRLHGTEVPFTSPLNKEHRKGTFACAGCELPLFTSAMKFESGTGWPSFFTSIPGAFETKKDFFLVYPRTEYHCKRCGGHHGHVFDDGPQPTGQRWCNNGVALKFIPRDTKT